MYGYGENTNKTSIESRRQNNDKFLWIKFKRHALNKYHVFYKWLNSVCGRSRKDHLNQKKNLEKMIYYLVLFIGIWD